MLQLQSFEEIQQFFRRYSEDLIKEKILVIEPSDFHYYEDVQIFGLGIASVESKEYKEFRNFVLEKVRNELRDRTPDIAARLFKIMLRDPKEFIEILETGKFENISINHYPIFHFINPDEFVKNFVIVLNSDKRGIARAVKARFNNIWDDQIKNKEKEFIRTIIKLLTDSNQSDDDYKVSKIIIEEIITENFTKLIN